MTTESQSQPGLPAKSAGHASHSNSTASPKFDVTWDSLSIELRTIQDRNRQLSGLLRELGAVVSARCQCAAIWYSTIADDSDSYRIHDVSDDNSAVLLAVGEDDLRAIIGLARDQQQTCTATIESFSARIIAAPVLANQPSDATGELIDTVAVLTGCFTGHGDHSPVESLMGRVGDAISEWFSRQLQARRDQQTDLLARSLSLLVTIDRTSTTEQAAIVLVNQLRRDLASRQVALVRRRAGKRGQLIAVSDVERIDAHAPSTAIFISAATETLETKKPVAFPPIESAIPPTEPVPSTHALAALCRSQQHNSALTIPIRDAEDKVLAALVIAFDTTSIAVQSVLDAEQFARVAGPRFGKIFERNLGSVEKATTAVRSLPRKRWAVFSAAALLVTTLLMLLPLPYRVGCDCEIQPVTRTFVAAPFDGILEESNVVTGQLVSAGDLLARLDGRQLRIEQSSLSAERSGARRERDSALARGEVASSQIATSKMKQLESREKLISDQLSRLEIRSPRDGIVIKGDLDKVEGAPLEMGQTLFEIAPLDTMIAEVAIPESEIAYVSESDEVVIRVDSFAMRSWRGHLKRIEPSAQQIGDDSAFLAEIRIDNGSAELRPGMRGRAKIATASRPLGWNLFHRPWETIRYWTVW